jgi:Tol biopolymer transport system component
MSTGVTKRVSVASDGSEANGHSDCWNGSVSDDGRFVVFVSHASNLVPNDTNGKSDIFVHELSTGITERVSIASDGTEANGWTS